MPTRPGLQCPPFGANRTSVSAGRVGGDCMAPARDPGPWRGQPLPAPGRGRGAGTQRVPGKSDPLRSGHSGTGPERRDKDGSQRWGLGRPELRAQGPLTREADPTVNPDDRPGQASALPATDAWPSPSVKWARFPRGRDATGHTRRALDPPGVRATPARGRGSTSLGLHCGPGPDHGGTPSPSQRCLGPHRLPQMAWSAPGPGGLPAPSGHGAAPRLHRTEAQGCRLHGLDGTARRRLCCALCLTCTFSPPGALEAVQPLLTAGL